MAQRVTKPQPLAYAPRLPGDYGPGSGSTGYVPTAWYQHRLGLIDDHGRETACGAGMRAALVHYRAELVAVDAEHPRYCALYRYAVPDGTQKRDEERGPEWSWQAVRRPTLMPQGKVLSGTTLGDRFVYANFWRARLNMLGGDDLSRDAFVMTDFLAKELARGEHPAVAPLYLGPSIPPARLADPGALRFPKPDDWLRVATGCDCLPYLVVDLDCHREAHRAGYDAALRFFTQTPGMPRPGLVVTSQGGGRHLYYFLNGRTPVACQADTEADYDRYSKPFREAIEAAFRFTTMGGFIEVFPKGRSTKSNTPSLPFGPGSFLCDDDGAVLEKDPFAAVALWHRRVLAQPLARYGVREFEAIRRISASAVDPRVLHALQTRSKEKMAQEDEGVVGPETPRSSGSTADRSGHQPLPVSSNNRSVEEVQEVIAAGPTPGEVNEWLMPLAQYWKYHCRMDADAADRQFDQWIRRHPSPDGAFKSYLVRFRAAFTKARSSLYRGGRPGYRLTPGDCLGVARLVLGWGDDFAIVKKRRFGKQRMLAPFRRRLIRFMLACTGLARWQGLTEACEVHIASTLMQEWDDAYTEMTHSLKKHHWLRVDALPVRPGRGEARAAEYGFPLGPADGEPQGFQTHTDIQHYATEMLILRDEHLGRALAGPRNWPNWKRASAAHRAKIAAGVASPR